MELHDLEQFNANILERKTEIEKKTDGVVGTHPIDFRGKTEKLPVISVRIGFPVYRLKNGRTSTYQLEYLALHPDLPNDYFSRDNDAVSAQRSQHEVLGRLVEEENLLKSFKNEEQQVQPLICTNTGVVVNGNRRLCAWRTLYLSNPIRYKCFETIEIAVLPECDEQEIIALEEKLQIQKEKRAEYKWHAKAMMALQREKNNTKHSVVAKAFDMSPQGLTTLFEALHYGERYLETIGKSDHWSLIDKEFYAFEKLVKNIKKLNNQGDQDLFETLVFSMISQGSTSGRLYDVIDDVLEHFDALKSELVKKHDIEVSDDTPNSDVDDVSDDIMSESMDETDDGDMDDSALDILAGEHVEEDEGSKIAAVIRRSDDDSKAKIIKEVHNVIESENAIKSEMEAATYLIKQVSKASTLLRAAADQGLNDDTETSGVQEHLEAIKSTVQEIEKWLRGE